jgi:hypothetical protein
MRHAAKRGFSLLEVLVAISLVGLGVAGSMGAMSSISKNQVRVIETERMERLAADKLAELISTGEAFNGDGSGSFDGGRDTQDMTWKSLDEPTGTENLDVITITVTKGDREVSVSTLRYRAPADTGTTAQ